MDLLFESNLYDSNPLKSIPKQAIFKIRINVNAKDIYLSAYCENEFDKCFFQVNETANIKLIASTTDKSGLKQLNCNISSINFKNQINCNFVTTTVALRVLSTYQQFATVSQLPIMLTHDGKTFNGNLHISKALQNNYSIMSPSANHSVGKHQSIPIVYSTDELIRMKQRSHTPSTSIIGDDGYNSEDTTKYD